mmetsp:Transcript_12856/g.30125  ORF Transcript_12856/g.30125 Transcript_12856/m.30125 type:complete len:313 (-) Transcript_12856:72-1010(-)
MSANQRGRRRGARVGARALLVGAAIVGSYRASRLCQLPLCPAPSAFCGSAAPGVGVSPRAEIHRAAAPEVDLSTPAIQQFLDRHVIDEEAMMSKSDFPIPADKLIKLAKFFLATEAPEAVERGDGSILTDDFKFIGPVIGPLNKEEFLDTVDSVDFFRVFPDATAQFHHFRVDPFEPDRVWFQTRGTGLHSGSAIPGSDTDMMFGEPTNIRFVNPPQAASLRFNEDGKVRQFTIGYVMDRYVGNTGGLGGFFGPLYAVGKKFPFPEGDAWRPSIGYQIYVTLGAAFNRLRASLEGKEPKDLIVMPKGSDEKP